MAVIKVGCDHTHTRASLLLLRWAKGSPNCQKRFGYTYLQRLAQLRLHSAGFTKIEPYVMIPINGMIFDFSPQAVITSLQCLPEEAHFTVCCDQWLISDL